MAKECIANGDTSTECRDFQYDTFKLYPQNYLMPDGRIYLTRGGDWNSLRTSFATYIRRTKFTYFIEMKGNKSHPDVEFSRGPDLPLEFAYFSGTSLWDPNSNAINAYGGMKIYGGGTLYPGIISSNWQQNISDGPAATPIANGWFGSRGSRGTKYILSVFVYINTSE